MTTSVLLSIILTAQGGNQTGGGAATQKSAGELISKMFARYATAKTVQGTVVLTQTAMNQSGKIQTELQYEEPGKVYLRQRKLFKSSTGNQEYLIVADGKYFMYNAPPLPGTPNDQKLLEKLNYLGKTLGARDVYGAAGEVLADRSAALDIVFGRNEDLKFIRDQWINFKVTGTTKVGDEEVYVILGDWRDKLNSPVSAQFRLWITEQGDLKQYAKSEKVMGPANQPFEVLSYWDVEIKVNAETNASLYKIR